MDKIKEYAVTNYPKTFKDVKDVIVEENDIVFFILYLHIKTVHL